MHTSTPTQGSFNFLLISTAICSSFPYFLHSPVCFYFMHTHILPLHWFYWNIKLSLQHFIASFPHILQCKLVKCRTDAIARTLSRVNCLGLGRLCGTWGFDFVTFTKNFVFPRKISFHIFQSFSCKYYEL